MPNACVDARRERERSVEAESMMEGCFRQEEEFKKKKGRQKALAATWRRVSVSEREKRRAKRKDGRRPDAHLGNFIQRTGTE
jgi:hypothetical protein